MERLGKYLMGGSVIAGLADCTKALYHKITIQDLSGKLLRFIESNNVSEETLQKALQKLSEIKDVTVSYATHKGEQGIISLNPLKFASGYLNGLSRGAGSPLFKYSSDIGFWEYVGNVLPKDTAGIGVAATFNDGRIVGGYHINAIMDEVGGYGILEKMHTVENVKNIISDHQTQLNTALGLLIPITLTLGIGAITYLRAGGAKHIKREVGRIYDTYIRTPLALKRAEGYHKMLYNVE